jgi:hypothetical protein
MTLKSVQNELVFNQTINDKYFLQILINILISLNYFIDLFYFKY